MLTCGAPANYREAHPCVLPASRWATRDSREPVTTSSCRLQWKYVRWAMGTSVHACECLGRGGAGGMTVLLAFDCHSHS